jgi:N-acetylglutamate synthase-like GNAT family acetyltransferase
MTDTVAIRNAVPADIPRIVALLNVAFAMERAFVDRDRTSVEEITAYLGTGTFLVIDGDRDALAACVYLEQRGSRVYLGMLAVDPSYQGAAWPADDGGR